eukprot:2028857-Pyramimonas_sp.AAC.1
MANGMPRNEAQSHLGGWPLEPTRPRAHGCFRPLCPQLVLESKSVPRRGARTDISSPRPREAPRRPQE